MFITAFTRAHHLSMFWARTIRSMLPIPLLEEQFIYCPPIYAQVSKLSSFPRVSPPESCMNLSSPPYELHSPPISFFLISSSECSLVRNIANWAPLYVVFSTSLLPRPLKAKYHPHHHISHTALAYVSPSVLAIIQNKKQNYSFVYLYLYLYSFG